MAERKNPKFDVQHQAILKGMMQLPENKTCADCKGPYPRWASTNLGIFICMACSGIHRKLGTHLSQVRSITLDTWTVKQIEHFQKLGNSKAGKYFEACLPSNFKRPHSSDSMRMETFIRDKYEHRRYITTENGGLGGDSSQQQPFVASNSNSNRIVHRQQQRPYDDGGLGSYGARFSSSNVKQQRSVVQSTGRTTASNGASVSNVKNPVVRATTLKELVNMGFSTDNALSAVEASGGDLQQAVDWILHNSNKPKTATSAVVTNLVDFQDTPPVKVQSQQQQTKTCNPNHFTDFSDFGEFESALPSMTVSSSAPSKNIGNGRINNNNNLSSSLADLYKRPAPTVTRPPPPMASTAATTTFQFSGIQTSENRNKISPTTPALDGSKLGLATIDLNNTTRTTRNQTHLNKHSTTINTTRLVSSTPPPPPMQKTAILSSELGPPPPSPPQRQTRNAVVSMSMSTEDNKRRDIDSSDDNDMITEDTSTAVEHEDVDPFAALSMMALSSASGKKKGTM